MWRKMRWMQNNIIHVMSYPQTFAQSSEQQSSISSSCTSSSRLLWSCEMLQYCDWCLYRPMLPVGDRSVSLKPWNSPDNCLCASLTNLSAEFSFPICLNMPCNCLTLKSRGRDFWYSFKMSSSLVLGSKWYRLVGLIFKCWHKLLQSPWWPAERL